MTMDDTDKDAAEILSPVAATSRIASLDVMRGLAVLGILAVNVVSFGLPVMVYQDASLSPFPVTGANAMALIKASFVLLMNDADKYLLSTRNQFTGTVSKVTPGAVNAEVIVDLPGGASIASIVTMGSIKNLGLEPGKKVTAIVKASQVILAVAK